MDPYEGGVRVPAIYSDPRLPLRTRGTKRDFLMHISDWFLTFPHLANKSFVVGKSDVSYAQGSLEVV